MTGRSLQLFGLLLATSLFASAAWAEPGEAGRRGKRSKAQGVSDEPPPASAEETAAQEASEADGDDEGEPADAREGNGVADSGDAEPGVVDAAAAQAAGGPKITVMVPDFRAASEEVTPEALDTITGLVVYQLSKVERLEVVSGTDIKELLQLESDRAATGCTDTSCLSEIADALGAELIVSGQIGVLGPKTVIQLSLISTVEAKVLARSELGFRKPGELPVEIKRAVHELTEPYGGLPGYDAEKAKAENAPRTGAGRMLVDFANDPDTVMLFAMLVVGLTGIFPPMLLITPLLQALVLWCFADTIAAREYPYWWLAIPVGWATYLGAFLSTVILSGTGTALTVLAPGSVVSFVGVGLTGASTSVGTLMIFALEPTLVWWAGTISSRDASLFTDEGEAPEDEEKESDTPAKTTKGEDSPDEDGADAAEYEEEGSEGRETSDGEDEEDREEEEESSFGEGDEEEEKGFGDDGALRAAQAVARELAHLGPGGLQR